MADQTDDAIIREINSELREEQMNKLWKRYGSAIIGVAVAVVVIVAGYQGWKTYSTSVRMSEGEKFHSAELAAESGDSEAALAQLAALGESGKSGYGVLALFQQAAILSAKGDSQSAADIYKTIATDKSNANDISGLALVLGALQEISIGGNHDELAKRLNAANTDDNPWRYSIREILGLVAIETGNKENAAKLFGTLAIDNMAPEGIRDRARKLLAGLGS
ncbi:MAG: tetratricopeptide repeat protein [Rhodospirillaceae bacterium]|nr:tetratricopeptide repeat protein [Rhodospirillaceae bacterium]